MLVFTAVLFSGCAKTWNEADANGGLFFSSTSDYIVRNDSGGKIMDVWVLHDVIVQADHGGAGYLFKDQEGNSIHLGGDCKVLRLNTPSAELRLEAMQKYHEYHAEFQNKSYQELYGKN